MKPKVLYYSDCPFFAGCENMIANFMNSDEINNKFEIHFLYRDSVDYKKGINDRVIHNNSRLIPIKLPVAQVHRRILKHLNSKSLLYLILSVIIIPIWKYYSIFSSVIPLYRLIKLQKVDLLHINNGGYPAASSCYSMIIAAKLAGVSKIVYVVNNLAQNYKHPLRWFDLLLDRFVHQNVQIFITGSENAAKQLRKVLSLSKNKVINIPNGIDLRKPLMNRTEFLAKVGINTTNKMIFSVIALLETRKGHIWLLRAIKILADTIPHENIPLFIFEGEGEQKTKLIEFVKKNNLEQIVFLVGQISNIYDLYYASDAIILPSVSNEDFPNVIIEAMGIGKPAIGTRIAGIPEQIDDGINGILVDPYNSIQLADAIVKLKDRSILNIYSKNCKLKFEKNYTQYVSVSKYIEVYNNLLNP